jgi:hypothetical protein
MEKLTVWDVVTSGSSSAQLRDFMIGPRALIAAHVVYPRELFLCIQYLSIALHDSGIENVNALPHDSLHFIQNVFKGQKAGVSMKAFADGIFTVKYLILSLKHLRMCTQISTATWRTRPGMSCPQIILRNTTSNDAFYALRLLTNTDHVNVSGNHSMAISTRMTIQTWEIICDDVVLIAKELEKFALSISSILSDLESGWKVTHDSDDPLH